MAPVIAVRTMAMISLVSIDVPLMCWLAVGICAEPAVAAGICGTAVGDFERIAMGRNHVQRRAGFDRRLAFHLGVPRSAAVAHAREARTLVDPVLEARRLAGVHLRHLPFSVLRAVDVHA